jgi:pre-mRNA-splicing factor SYF1
LAALLDNPRFQSKQGKIHFQLWGEMIELLVWQAKDINTSAHAGINVDSIIRSGIERFPAALSTIQRSNLEGVLGSIDY